MDARGVLQKSPLFRRFWAQCAKGQALSAPAPLYLRFPPPFSPRPARLLPSLSGIFQMGYDLQPPVPRLKQDERRALPVPDLAVQADDIALPLAPHGV